MLFRSQDLPEKIVGTSSSSSASFTEILKVMTEPISFAMLSPLGSDLTRLLQPKEKGSKKAWKGRRRLLWQLAEMRGSKETTHDGCDDGYP